MNSGSEIYEPQFIVNSAQILYNVVIHLIREFSQALFICMVTRLGGLDQIHLKICIIVQVKMRQCQMPPPPIYKQLKGVLPPYKIL